METDLSNVRFKGDSERAATVYAKLKALTAEDVADAIHYMLSAPAHVTVADLTLYPQIKPVHLSLTANHDK